MLSSYSPAREDNIITVSYGKYGEDAIRGGKGATEKGVISLIRGGQQCVH